MAYLVADRTESEKRPLHTSQHRSAGRLTSPVHSSGTYPTRLLTSLLEPSLEAKVHLVLFVKQIRNRTRGDLMRAQPGMYGLTILSR